jgi:hypothetical protein
VSARSRVSALGVLPVQRRKLRVNAVASANPTRTAIPVMLSLPSLSEMVAGVGVEAEVAPEHSGVRRERAATRAR